MTESAPEASPQTESPSSHKPDSPARRNWILWGGAALAAAVVAVVTLVLVMRPSGGLKPDQLNSILLDAAEVNTILGTSDMKPGELQVEPARSQGQISNPECLSALGAVQMQTYASSGYTASRWGWLKDSESNIKHYVVQAVTTFPDADKANEFLRTAAGQWKACEGQTVTVTAGAVDTWLIGTGTGEPPSIALLENRTDVEGWANQRAMRAVSNVVIDVSAAGYEITDQAETIADRIAANVPQ